MLKQNLIISLPTLNFVGMQQEPDIYFILALPKKNNYIFHYMNKSTYKQYVLQHYLTK